MDLFEKFTGRSNDPITALSRETHGVGTFPKLTGDIGNHMDHHGKRQLVWSINNYLGLANHPEVRAADAEGATQCGLAAPMGSRIMSGETDELEALEAELAEYARKTAALFVNYGYQGMVSLIDSLIARHDWVVYDAESHACIIDGIRIQRGRARSYPHNDIERLDAILARIETQRAPDEAVLVVTEGVFGMSGQQGRVADIVALKEKYDFRLLVDDAHGFGVLGPNGGGTGEEQAVQNGIDLYFGTFAKAGASIGAFVASESDVVWRLRYSMRSQIFAKGLPWPIVAANRVRLRLIRTCPELRKQAWTVAERLQSGLRDRGLEIGNPASLITPVYLPMTPTQGNDYVRKLREEYGVFCSVVTYPAVPQGIVQLRLISTAAHEIADVEPTVDAICRTLEGATDQTATSPLR